MSRFSKIPAILVAAGLLPAVLPLAAQTSDIDALKAQVQKLGEQVKELKDQQKADQAAKTAATQAGGLSTNVLGGTITLYGDIDVYANHMSSSSGTKINAFEDGAILRSRWGLKGEKPMGDGYAMKFTLEGGFNALNGQGADLPSYNSTLNSTYGGRLFDRQAWVGFATPAGEVRFGRQNTTIFFKGAEIDFGERTLGGIINLFGVPSRYDADVCYISPRIEGFQAQLHYAFGGSNAAMGNTNQHVRQYSLDYVNGPLSVGYMEIDGAPPSGAKYPASVRAGMSRTVPLQRLGSVAEHAWLVALLASPLGRAFNGSTVTLDGARDNWCGPWPPEGLADESGEVPVEERR